MKVSQWAYQQAVAEVDCQRCGSPAGKPCRAPSSSHVAVHFIRHQAYRKKIGEVEWNRRHRVKVADKN